MWETSLAIDDVVVSEGYLSGKIAKLINEKLSLTKPGLIVHQQLVDKLNISNGQLAQDQSYRIKFIPLVDVNRKAKIVSIYRKHVHMSCFLPEMG